MRGSFRRTAVVGVLGAALTACSLIFGTAPAAANAAPMTVDALANGDDATPPPTIAVRTTP